MLDLTAIKARRDHGYDMPDISRTLALIDIDALLLEVERLTAELAICHESAIDHTDDETHSRCEVEGCTASADYEGWYRVVDFSGNPTGLTQLREVCAEHAPMLIGWKE